MMVEMTETCSDKKRISRDYLIIKSSYICNRMQHPRVKKIRYLDDYLVMNWKGGGHGLILDIFLKFW
jgi:hypothetical protein